MGRDAEQRECACRYDCTVFLSTGNTCAITTYVRPTYVGLHFSSFAVFYFYPSDVTNTQVHAISVCPLIIKLSDYNANSSLSSARFLFIYV